ncbi:MAG TPA: nitronate monooxygenase [Pseudonocardia sp.]|uniref:NAD(P)H-dependent flavin oxidoreductase n=1 Tax=Pseudonocardia sp. TaxID=60912 RepID=UPI002B4B3668|nr:nitronate monooxygenase [Pseudonocardia sp.]HLU58447.1 nitronate monooxygenase [Pseudonocardia sp.]
MLTALDSPIVLAPMAGGPTTPELVAAVSGAGGFGFVAGGYLDAHGLGAAVAAVRERTARPFGVNLFLPGERCDAGVERYRARLVAAGFDPGEPVWDDDAYPDKLALLLADPVPVVSFTFGCPDPDAVARLHAVGSEVLTTVTNPDEARQAAEAGVDGLVVQGFEAGGHRGVFDNDPADPAGGPQYGLLALLRLVAAAVDLPLVAAGGIVDGAGVAAVLAAGAVAAQLGTAFLACPEAGTKPAHRAALAASDGAPTAMTRAFTGRPARAIRNTFLDVHTAAAPAAYPQVHHTTRPIRAHGDPATTNLWAGQAYPLARPLPAAELVATLLAEAREAASRAAAGVAR